MTISPEQCRASRALLGISQSEVAESAHVAVTTLADFEQGVRLPTFNNLQAIRSVLEKAGVKLVSEKGGGAGARLRTAPEAVNEAAISPGQCRAARAILNLSQTGLARTVGVGRSTVADFERGARIPAPANLTALRDTLKAAGIEFIDADQTAGPGVRLRM